MGFILSTLFYFIVDEIPEMIKIAKAKKILFPKVNNLLQNMNVIINLIILKYGCSTDLYSLTKKDFLILDGNVTETFEEISYCINAFQGRKRKTGVRTFGTLDDIIKNKIEEILKDVDYIKNYEYLYVTCTEFMEEIRNIEVCRLIKNYRKTAKSPNKCFIYADTSDMMVEFVHSYLKLKKLKFHTEYSVITMDSEEETKTYHDERVSGSLLSIVMNSRRCEHARAVSNPTLVVFSNSYCTQIISDKMKRDLEATYVNLKQFEKDMVNNYKYLVVIADKKSFKEFEKILREIHIYIKVILVTEKTIRFHNCERRIGNINIEVMGEFLFKTSKRIGKTHFYINKDEPTASVIHNLVKQIKEIAFEHQIKTEAD